MHVIDLISFWAKTAPERPALVVPDMVVNYKGLAGAVDSVTRHLAQFDLDRREPVAVAIDDASKLMPVCLAFWRSGYTIAPTTVGMLPGLRDAGIRNTVSTASVTILSAGTHIQFQDSWLGGNVPPGASGTPAANYGDLIFLTSGTTGVPKKILETGQALLTRWNSSVLTGGAAHARVLIIPGLASHFGFNVACDVLRSGKSAFFSPVHEAALWMIDKFEIEFINASTAQALALCELREKYPNYRLDSLRALRIGGSTVSPQLVERVRKILCPEVIIVYSSTEAAQAATAPYSAIEHVPDAVGYVVPWAKVEIVNDAGRPLPPGREGRVRYRTPFYIKNLEAAHPGRAIDDKEQWFYPGDVGSLTEDGILCIRGRTDDLINRGGVKMSAAAMEQQLLRCPGVKDAAVCGGPATDGLPELWIAVVPDANFDLSELQNFLAADVLAGADMPSEIHRVFAVNEIPRTDLGKVRRHELWELLAALQRRSQLQS
jgi:acyl-coenzyme A synthetase/AMP-(fatty) acid ligase